MPSIATCIMQAHGELIFEKYEHYQKRSFRNRYLIRDSNGIHTLSIPLCKGKNNQQLITEVEISYDTNWMKQHLYSIQTAYGKSPYYNFYKDDFMQRFCAQEKYLWNWNLSLNTWLFEKMKLVNQIHFTTDYEKQTSISIIDLRNNFDIMLMQSQLIVSKNEFDPFYKNLNYAISGLDLLFNLGPDAKNFLLNLRTIIV